MQQKMTKDDFFKKILKLGKYFGKVCEFPEDYFDEFGEFGDEYFDEITAEIKREHRFARFPLIADFYAAIKRIEAKESERKESLDPVKSKNNAAEAYEKLTESDIAEAKVMWNFFKEVNTWRWIGSTRGIEFKKQNGYVIKAKICQLSSEQMIHDTNAFKGCDVYEWNKRGRPSLFCPLTNFYLNYSDDAFRVSKLTAYWQMCTEELKYLRKQQTSGIDEPASGLLKNFKLQLN